MTSSRLPGALIVWLGAAVLAAALATLAAPGLLRGPDAMNGSAQGTALIMLLVGLPAYVVAAISTRAGSYGAEVLLTGVTAYLLYNAVMFVFATPVNRLFLLYVALLGLALFALVHEVLEVWARAGEARALPPHWVAGYVLAVVALNALAWLARVVPATLGSSPGSLLDGTGLTTNPVYVQDLAFWLPAMAWLGVGMWRGLAPHAALASAGLAMWVLEALGVAVDQWWAHAADPASAVAATAAVPLFLAVAAIGAVPALVAVRAIGGPHLTRTAVSRRARPSH